MRNTAPVPTMVAGGGIQLRPEGIPAFDALNGYLSSGTLYHPDFKGVRPMGRFPSPSYRVKVSAAKASRRPCAACQWAP